MNLLTLRKEIWRTVGEPTYLDPSTDVQYGGAPLLNMVVNEATRAIASWKDPVSLRRVMLPKLEEETFFKMAPKTGTLTSDATDASNVILPSTWGSSDDMYNGWILSVNGETKVIMDYTGSTKTALLESDLSSTPATGDEITLYKRFLLVLPSSDARAGDNLVEPADWEILIPTKVSDITNKRPIELTNFADDFIGTYDSISSPTEVVWRGNRLDFNYAPDAETWYKLEYYRDINEISGATEEPEIPRTLHWGIVLWGIWWAYRDQGSSPDAYSAKQDFVDFMRSKVMPTDFANIRNEDHGILDMGD